MTRKKRSRDMDRRIFDTEMKEFFPGAVVSREEYKSGWIDSIEIGEIIIEIAVLDRPQRGSARGRGIAAYMKAKTDTHGNCLLWMHKEKSCDPIALRVVLQELKKHLLGISAAITQMCGFSTDPPEEIEDMDEFDLAELEAYLNADKPKKKVPKAKDIDRMVEGLLGEDDEELDELDFLSFDSFD